MSELLLRYPGERESLKVELIHKWRRGDIEAPAMSASSGPKDYIRNDVYAIFDKAPDIAAVAMVLARGVKGPLFFIVHRNGKWCDYAVRKDNGRDRVEMHELQVKAAEGFEL